MAEKNPHIWDELCPLKTYRFKTVNESLKDINIKQSTVKLLKTKNKGEKKKSPKQLSQKEYLSYKEKPIPMVADVSLQMTETRKRGNNTVQMFKERIVNTKCSIQ